jgi:hypothetical protein
MISLLSASQIVFVLTITHDLSIECLTGCFERGLSDKVEVLGANAERPMISLLSASQVVSSGFVRQHVGRESVRRKRKL